MVQDCEPGLGEYYVAGMGDSYALELISPVFDTNISLTPPKAYISSEILCMAVIWTTIIYILSHDNFTYTVGMGHDYGGSQCIMGRGVSGGSCPYTITKTHLSLSQCIELQQDTVFTMLTDNAVLFKYCNQ